MINKNIYKQKDEMINMKDAKRKILIASFFTSLMLLIPFTTVAGDPSSILDTQRIEETDNIMSSAVADLSKLSKEEVIDILKMIIDDFSLEYSDDPEIQQIISLIEVELSHSTVNEEGVTESSSGLCALLLSLIILRVARILGLKIAEILTIIAGYADIYTFIEYVRLTIRSCVILIILCEIYISLCTDYAGGSTSTLVVTDVLNIESVETLIMSFDCRCMQGSPTSN